MEKRRSVLKKMIASVAGLSVFGKSKEAMAAPAEKVVNNVTTLQDVPLFSGSTKLGNMVFIAGKGAHVEPFEIKAHTEIVLKELEKELIKAGSSMEKDLRVGVFLNDIADFQGMNKKNKNKKKKKQTKKTTKTKNKNKKPNNTLVEM